MSDEQNQEARRATAKGHPMTFSPDEAQPAAAVSEQKALSEREDGVNRGDETSPYARAGSPVEAIPGLVLTDDEEQPISADAERSALSEREDGTNRG